MASTTIASDRVEGTKVYRNGDKLGSIDNLVIDKRSGLVRYAAPGVRRLPGHRPDLVSDPVEPC